MKSSEPSLWLYFWNSQACSLAALAPPGTAFSWEERHALDFLVHRFCYFQSFQTIGERLVCLGTARIVPLHHLLFVHLPEEGVISSLWFRLAGIPGNGCSFFQQFSLLPDSQDLCPHLLAWCFLLCCQLLELWHFSYYLNSGVGLGRQSSGDDCGLQPLLTCAICRAEGPGGSPSLHSPAPHLSCSSLHLGFVMENNPQHCWFTAKMKCNHVRWEFTAHQKHYLLFIISIKSLLRKKHAVLCVSQRTNVLRKLFHKSSAEEEAYTSAITVKSVLQGWVCPPSSHHLPTIFH